MLGTFVRNLLFAAGSTAADGPPGVLPPGGVNPNPCARLGGSFRPAQAGG